VLRNATARDVDAPDGGAGDDEENCPRAVGRHAAERAPRATADCRAVRVGADRGARDGGRGARGRDAAHLKLAISEQQAAVGVKRRCAGRREGRCGARAVGNGVERGGRAAQRARERRRRERARRRLRARRWRQEQQQRNAKEADHLHNGPGILKARPGINDHFF
jgi:hypothetical protein